MASRIRSISSSNIPLLQQHTRETRMASQPGAGSAYFAHMTPLQHSIFAKSRKTHLLRCSCRRPAPRLLRDCFTQPYAGCFILGDKNPVSARPICKCINRHPKERHQKTTVDCQSPCHAAAVRPMSAPVRLVPLRLQWPEPPVRTVQHVAQKWQRKTPRAQKWAGGRKKKRDCAERVQETERERDAMKRGLDGGAATAVARGRESARRMRHWCGVERDGG